MANITFRNSKIVYYGPHSCGQCGVLVCKMGLEWGGAAFTYPEGSIYPNTEWHVHVCDPKLLKTPSAPADAASPTQPRQDSCGWFEGG